MPWRKSPRALIDLFDAALPADPRIERRKMFGYPAAFRNGRLFASPYQESMIIKLPANDRQLLVRQCHARTFEPMPGRTMREYLVVPEVDLADRGKLAAWLERSSAFVGGLPPKPDKPKKKRADVRAA